MLKDVLKDSTHVRYVQHIGENGVRLFQAAAELRVKGIVAKRADSAYRRGRTSDWVKIKAAAGRAIDEARKRWNESQLSISLTTELRHDRKSLISFRGS